MTHYVAIVEEERDKAVGVWFPDLPGCFSAGDTVEEAMLNAREAISLWVDVRTENGGRIPPPRTVSELRDDPEVAQDLERYLVALIPFGEPLAAAAE
jgi:predicted RNase H-like HicB family nuclease